MESTEVRAVVKREVDAVMPCECMLPTMVRLVVKREVDAVCPPGSLANKGLRTK